MNSCLDKNLSLLRRTNTKLAFQIAHTDPSALEFCSTEQNETNLKRVYEGKTYFYHSPKGASQEAKEWAQRTDLNHATVIFVYGIGLGYYFLAAQEWLEKDKNRVLIFLEEDLGVLHRLLETETGSVILRHPQVKIYTFNDVLEDHEIFNEISWTYLFCPFIISSLSLYQEVNPEGFSKLSHRIAHDAVQKKALVDEYLQYGVAFFRNFYPNLLELPKAFWGNGLFGKFKNTPAIICGAGPSLNKNIETLGTLTENALIFAGSSSLKALLSKNVIPHFAAAIDPNSAQLERVEIAQGHSIPFFYRNRLFHRALNAIEGPRLYLSGSGGYEVAEWFENELGLEGETLDEGHNVINMSLSIAHALGCNPIIFVGVDLAYTDNQIYADGVMSNSQMTNEETDFDSTPILKEDINGNPVKTLWKWVTEAEWISEFAKQHPELTIINATEGGLGFKDIPNSNLSEVVKRHLMKSSDLYTRVHQEIEKNKLPSTVNKQHIEELMGVMQASLNRCIQHFDQLIGMQAEDLNAQLIEMAIEEEIAYRYILDVFNMIFLRVHHRSILAAKDDSQKKIDLHVRRLQFLKDVARVNSELIKMSCH